LEPAFSIVFVDEFLVGFIKIGKRGGVGAIGRFTQQFRGEAALAVVAEDDIVEGLVAALGKKDVEIAILSGSPKLIPAAVSPLASSRRRR